MRRLIARPLEMLVLPLVALLSVGGSIAEAADLNPALLMGDYHFSRTRTCIRASGFDTGNELALQSAGSTATDAAQGTSHYNGDGTGTVIGQLLSINHNGTGNGAKPVTQVDFTCDLTYTVHADDTFTEMLTCTGSFIAGGGTGSTFTATVIEQKGLFANGRKSFVFGSVNPDIETITVTPLAGPRITVEAICSRSGTAFKVN